MEYTKMEQADVAGIRRKPSGERYTDKKKAKPSLLLHSCCGPCSTAVIERLAPDFRITVFFYNPNITDEEEYILRRNAQIKFIDAFNRDFPFDEKIGFIEGEYDPRLFYEAAAGFEDEPEGGERCGLCFKLRLDRTALKAKALGCDAFGTTLTVSPHKNYRLISEIGAKASFENRVAFLDMDFKKKAGFQRSVELSKKFDIYRQRFCGCQFSK